MEVDRCRCGDSAKDVAVTLCSGTGHPEVWKQREPGQHRRALSHRDVPLLMCCGCPVCKGDKKFMIRPCHCPQPAEMLLVQPGQGWCPRWHGQRFSPRPGVALFHSRIPARRAG